MSLFQEIISHFQSTTQYDKFIRDSERQYDIKIYKLAQYTLQYVKHNIQDLTFKYNLGKIDRQPTGWNENERKLFVWFIISFLNYKMIDIVKFIDGCQRYWKVISITFWDKEIPFLKYQVLNLVKVKGRAIWKTQQEQLLVQAYNIFKKGDWNEIAKHIYFQSDCKIFKTPKQCRERWQNHLNNNILKGNWNQEQDKCILNFVKEKGKKWAQIFRVMKSTRTEHMIKNRYQSLIKKQLKKKVLRSANQEEALVNLIRDHQNFIEYYESQIIIDEIEENHQNHELQQKSKKKENKMDQNNEKSLVSSSNNLEVEGCYFQFRSSYKKKKNMIIFNNQEIIKLDSSLKNASNADRKGIVNQIGIISYPSVRSIHSVHSNYFNDKEINLQKSLNNGDFGLKHSNFFKILSDSGYEKNIFYSNKFD